MDKRTINKIASMQKQGFLQIAIAKKLNCKQAEVRSVLRASFRKRKPSKISKEDRFLQARAEMQNEGHAESVVRANFG